MKGLLILSCIFVLGSATQQKNPAIDQVVQLIQGLAKSIENDGKDEQATYDKYACWVEDTLQKKAADISAAKELLPELDDEIKKGKAEIASHGAEIAQLTKDIAQNQEAQKDANAVRAKENKEYASERADNEQCTGALEAAVKVLTGAGTKASNFLQQFHQAELMSVAMGVRKVLQNTQTAAVVSEENLEVVKRFVQDPASFASGGIIAAQTGQNPFGDYAPQSSQIQGILKGMYDAFTSDIEKDNAEEANSQKSFESLMATKKQEQETLQSSLEKQETDQAAKTKKLAEDETLRDDTTDSLAADEKFFEETKDAAEAKATEWSTRTRLRTEELAGMEGAVQILTGGDKVFKESATTFIQLNVQKAQAQRKSYRQLKALAAKYGTASLAKLVSVMKTGGHFDKVFVMIDEMIALLRKEEQEDIEHRDRCENGENANANEMEDVNSAIAKTDKKLERLGRSKDNANKDLDAVKKEIGESEDELAEMLEFRNKDHAAFQRALKMDSEAITLIESAIVRLSSYYKENKIPLSLEQQPAPAADFSGGDAHKSESGGIVAILEMIKEDLQKEMKEGRADEAKAQADYEKQSGAAQDALDAQTETKVSLEKQISATDSDIAGAEKHKGEKKDDLAAEEDMKKSLNTDCTWVKTQFGKRRDARKSEMDGLVEAKNFLAGVESGDAVLAPGM